jgi:hypothetical protein
MDDRQLANAAAVYFGGRHRAAHILTCDRCHVDDDGKHVLCPSHPDRRREAAAR